MRKIYLSSLFSILLTGLIISAPIASLSASSNAQIENSCLLPGGGGGNFNLSNSTGNIPSALVKTLLMKAAPIFGVSFQVLLKAYQDGRCLITMIAPRTYKVTYGGGAAILILDGTN